MIERGLRAKTGMYDDTAFKYQTIEEIKQLPKYKELCQSLRSVAKDPNPVNRYDAGVLYIWYHDQLEQCKEYMLNFREWFNREYICKFVDVKDIGLGDKNIFKETTK